jgi:predicted ATPase
MKMTIRIEGPQGSGKTTIIEALKVCGFVVYDERRGERDDAEIATVEIPPTRGSFFGNLFSKSVKSRREPA